MTPLSLFEGKQPRRLLFRPDAGIELLDWLQRFTSLPQPRWAEVRVYGTARSVELRSLLSRGQAQRLSGTMELMDVRGLCGPNGAGLRGQLVLDQKQLLAGEILRLQGDQLVVVIDLLGELEPFADASPAAAPVAATPAGPAAAGWGDVLSASLAKSAEEEDDANAVLKAGDFLDHPKFGRCRVDRIEGDQQYATVRTHQHRMLRLSLEVLDLRPKGHDGKFRIWRVVGAGDKE